MIKVSERIWIGDSADGDNVGRHITAVLNVAVDLSLKGRWPALECAHVGLVDGPGNSSAIYLAATLTLADMARRRDTLVCCHSGGRALAVAIMCLAMQSGRRWDELLQMLQERVSADLPEVKTSHVEAFNLMNWKQFRTIIAVE